MPLAGGWLPPPRRLGTLRMAPVAWLWGAPALLALLRCLPEPAAADGFARPSCLAALAPALPRTRLPCAMRV
eukprot:3490566-Alexandrium_andersonii.AAC.1